MIKEAGIISQFQKELLISFSKLPDAASFYLTGGTALAEFYLHHRISFDLDLFTSENQLILPFSRNLEYEFRKNFTVKVIKRFNTFVEFEITKKT